jgi:hypothetical protein
VRIKRFVAVCAFTLIGMVPISASSALANDETIRAYAGCLAAAIQLKTVARMSGISDTEIYNRMVEKLSNRYFGQAETKEEFQYLSRIASDLMEGYRFLSQRETAVQADAFVKSRDCIALAFR